MGIGRLGVLGAAGLFVFLAALPARAADCRLLKVASFPINTEKTGAVTVPIIVNGTSETFIVDTGGIYSTLTKSTVEALHLKPLRITSGAEFYESNGGKLDHYVVVDRLGVGALHARNVKMLVDPGAAAVGMDQFQGALAPNILRNFDLDFDFAHKTLNLISPKHCEGKVVYWAQRYAVVPFTRTYALQIELPVTLDGHTFKAILDTGASRTAVRFETVVRKLGLTPKSPGMIPVPGADENTVVPFHYRFKTLTIGGITVHNPTLGILSDALSKSFWKHHNYDWLANDPVYGLKFKPQPIVLGLDVLSKLHLYIAYDEEKLYVTTADAAPSTPATSQ